MISDMVIFAILLLLASLMASIVIVALIICINSIKEGESDVLYQDKKSNKRK